MTETRPDDAIEVAATDPSAPATGLDRVLGSGDHKTIGRVWMGSGAIVLAAGLVLSCLALFDAAPDISFLEDGEQRTQIFSMGRQLVVFGGIVPLVVGLATFLVPLQVGSASIAFPRGAAAALWTWMLGVVVLVLSYIMNGGPAGGRVDYVVLWTIALGMVIAALIWALICVATTVLGARATGMDLEMVPFATWGFFVFSILAILAFPVVLGELVLAYIDVRYGYLPTKADREFLAAIGNTINLAPSIYLLAVPVLGMAVDAIGVHTGRPARFHRTLLAVIGLLGFTVYAVDMLSFAWRGRPVAFDNGLLVAATIGAVVPVLLILALSGESLGKGRPKVSTPLVGSLGAGLLFLLGTGAGVLGAVDPIFGFIETNFDAEIDGTLGLFGTSFHWGVRGLIVGGAVLGLIAALHHWGHKIWGRTLDDRLGLLAALAVLGGSIVWGVGGIVGGFADLPGLPAVATDASDAAGVFAVVMAIGPALVAAGVALTVLNLLGAAAGRSGTAAEPWTGLTLEWATASPPAASNFETAPVVSSATPLADRTTDDDEVER